MKSFIQTTIALLLPYISFAQEKGLDQKIDEAFHVPLTFISMLPLITYKVWVRIEVTRVRRASLIHIQSHSQIASVLNGSRLILPLDAESSATDAAERLDELLIPKDPNDGRNVIVEIRGAEGGEEANLFARDLFEMYRSYASTQPWRQEMLEANHSDMGGFSTVIFLLKGDSVWSHLKYEGGVHRVQRVPVTESQGRVHTSSATVSVLPEADEVEVAIAEGDLQIDVYRASGPGGQSVNTTDSAVRITHKPTGLVVSMQDEKSQLQNKAKAMQVLRARLLQAEQDKAAAEASDLRKGQIGGGGRSEKIRTYNYKENRVTDHRIGLTIYKLDKVLAGAMEDVIDPLMQHERAEQLSANE